MDYGKVATATATPNYPNKITPSGRLDASAPAKNMKFWPENRRNGLYEPENAIFRPVFRFSALTDAKTAKK